MAIKRRVVAEVLYGIDDRWDEAWRIVQMPGMMTEIKLKMVIRMQDVPHAVSRMYRVQWGLLCDA
jgi:DNA-binding transcriptional regulator PaaX